MTVGVGYTIIYLNSIFLILGMKSLDNLLFYSAASYLSYIINTQFYGKHYLWCAPIFNPACLSSLDPRRNIPTSSSPHDIYNLYYKDTNPTSSDRHSALIRQNKLGLKRGAKFKLASGVITQNEYQIIMQKIQMASINDFRPIIYIIPAALVGDRMKTVPVKLAANPLGTEYRVEDLIEGEFEIMEFNR